MSNPQDTEEYVLIKRDQHPPADLAQEYIEDERKIKQNELAVEINRACLYDKLLDERRVQNEMEDLGHYTATEKIKPIATFGGTITSFNR